MALQTQANILVAIKRETVTGTAATATGATQVRLVGSPGLMLKRANIKSVELREDGNDSMGRLGSKTVDGSYDTEVTVGGHTDIALEAVMRSAWVTAAVVGFASLTTVALGTNSVTATAGDWVGGQGVRVGDLFTITGTTVSGDNNLRVPVIAVTSLTITVPPASFTTLAATSTGTLTVLKKVVNALTPTRYTHTIEQYDEDTDLSELFLGCRMVGVKLSCKPGSVATMSLSFLGMDRTILTTGTSPWFTSPSLTTGLALAADDAVILYNGAVVTTFTGIDLDFSIGAAAQAVLGSFVSPDIFDNILSVGGTITGLRSDFSNLTLYDAETEFAVQVVLKELMTAPQNCLSIFLPRVKISNLSAPVGGTTGAKIETLSLMVGPKVASTGSEATIAKFSSSAP